MTSRRLELQRDIDLSPVIVWDALVDQDLVSGWLGEARIEAERGGRFETAWLGAVGRPGLSGSIAAISPPGSLTVTTTTHGALAFELIARSGGSRGDWTDLRLTVELEVDDVFAQSLFDTWRLALDQLEELLRGHPVDWGSGAPDASPQSTALRLER